MLLPTLFLLHLSLTVTQGTRNSKTSGLEVAGLQRRLDLGLFPSSVPTPWEQFKTPSSFIVRDPHPPALISLLNKNHHCLEDGAPSASLQIKPSSSILITHLCTQAWFV